MATMITRPSILRLRAGFLILAALLILSAMSGRWIAAAFTLNGWWALLIGLVVAVLFGVLFDRLPGRFYVGLAVLVALVAGYTTYDFTRGPVDWSQGASLFAGLVAMALLAAAFWDFWNLRQEIHAWRNDDGQGRL